MKGLTRFCKTLKKDFIPDPSKPVRCWSEKDVLRDEVVDAYVIVLRTRGCSWALKSGCTMCGYFNESMWRRVSNEDLLNQFNVAMQKYKGEEVVKIFTSGSFLDDAEVKPDVRDKILKRLAQVTDKVSVESRPEYITEDNLTRVEDIPLREFEVAIGLETSNDFTREYMINKGFTFADYKKAASVVKKHDFELKTYVLIKPPFLTEKDSIEECISTVREIKTITDIVSFNPTNVQRNTVVEYLWKRQQYRPAWLWSIVEILKKSKDILDGRVKCDVVGGGSVRGPRNCGICDRVFLDAIADFSLMQDEKVLEDLSCDCKERWLDQLDIENLSFGSIVDLSEFK